MNTILLEIDSTLDDGDISVLLERLHHIFMKSPESLFRLKKMINNFRGNIYASRYSNYQPPNTNLRLWIDDFFNIEFEYNISLRSVIISEINYIKDGEIYRVLCDNLSFPIGKYNMIRFNFTHYFLMSLKNLVDTSKDIDELIMEFLFDYTDMDKVLT